MAADTHPKIICIDLPDAVPVLQQSGLNAVAGTYGGLYENRRRQIGGRLFLSHNLPNFTEQEIVIVDVAPRPAFVEPLVEDPDRWKEFGDEVVNPIPRSMKVTKPLIERILDHGGVLIVFGWRRVPASYFEPAGNPAQLDNWSFIGLPQFLTVEADSGVELTTDGTHRLSRLLARHLTDVRFECAYQIHGQFPQWSTLASSKYRTPVAGIWRRQKGGTVFLLPQLAAKDQFLNDLLTVELPVMVPDLYPAAASSAQWVQELPYEHSEVMEVRAAIAEARQAYEQRLGQLNERIEAHRQAQGHLHDILRETGKPLVAAVHRTLVDLGFGRVVDVDTSDETELMEDLRLEDRSPVLLVEVKGIVGVPSDDDSMQVAKYVAPRMREWGRTDVAGLAIINHQRLRPALDRESHPFRDVVLDNARSQIFGLMTTWDLFRLARNAKARGWRVDDVVPIFYRGGRIEPVPEHYEQVGVVARFAKKFSVVGIDLTAGDVCSGDTIAFELPLWFVEQKVESLEVDNQRQGRAIQGQVCGVVTTLSRAELRDGVRVFRVRQPAATATAEATASVSSSTEPPMEPDRK